jgi:hypothetical protein
VALEKPGIFPGILPENSSEPKRPSCFPRKPGIFLGMFLGRFPGTEKTFVLSSLRYDMLEAQNLLRRIVSGKGDQHEAL